MFLGLLHVESNIGIAGDQLGAVRRKLDPGIIQRPPIRANCVMADVVHDFVVPGPASDERVTRCAYDDWLQ